MRAFLIQRRRRDPSATPTPRPERTNTHCQICGRLIQAKTGTIAHHGYQRPGQGWQTASCYGAKHLPYEVSRDIIQYAIEDVTARRERARASLELLLMEPPQGMLQRREFHDRRCPWAPGWENEVSWLRPEGYDPETPSFHHVANGQEYHMAFQRRRNQLAGDIKDMGDFIEYLRKRHDEWVPPAA